ncbi:hypothetical protein PoB_003058100 [Plakobranchus ocellatus]|uniref:Uncharacterized protein n=1 Tax=Plakobranchus ocellatus TaxID=259542 RepID=A0AAV3ZYP7_9GAST|nr:hypothetical protein PoB_003058100 [Plakobranchus ocellatus]
MDVDSMHAAIEREKKFVDIFTTNEWKTIPYGFDEQFKQMKLRGRGKHPSGEKLRLNPVYKKILPISQITKSDLLELCKKLVIPREYRAWYANLLSSDTSTDNAPEPAADYTGVEQTALIRIETENLIFAVIVCLRFGLQGIFM